MSLPEARKTIQVTSQGKTFFFPISTESFAYPPHVNVYPQNKGYGTNYKHLLNIGFSPDVKTTFNRASGGDVHCSYWDGFISANPQYASATDLAGYRKVERSRESFLKSIAKCDVSPVLPQNDELFQTALAYTERMFAQYMVGARPVSTIEFQPDTSPGIPWLRLGVKDKVHAVLHPEFQNYLDHNYIPLWNAIDKNEFLPVDDVANKKVRTIFSPPTDFIFKQKIFTTDMNERMVKAAEHFDTFWPRYGFVKQYGGFDRLMRHHSRFDIHFTSDGSGWDRVFSLMSRVWDQRAKFLFRGQTPPPLFDYVRDHVQSSFIVLPDGNIIRANNVGNRSGSDSTTSDNCWGHVIMTFYLALTIGLDKHHRVLTYEEIMANTAFSLYGDDNLGSLCKKFFRLAGVEELKKYVSEAYGSFGVVVKPSQFNAVEGHDLTSLEFLGSTAKFHNGYYYAIPRLQKLWTSLTRVLDTKEPDPVASCVSALFDLVSFTGGDPQCEMMKNLLGDYSIYLLNEPSFNASPSARALLARVATLQVDSFLQFGYEGECKSGR